MNVIVNIFAVFGSLIFFGVLALIIKDVINERRREYNVNNHLSDNEIAEYLQHDREMERIYELATSRSGN